LLKKHSLAKLIFVKVNTFQSEYYLPGADRSSPLSPPGKDIKFNYFLPACGLPAGGGQAGFLL